MILQLSTGVVRPVGKFIVRGVSLEFMNEFKPAELSDRQWILRLLNSCECPSYEYNFTTIFIWQQIYDLKVCEHNGFLNVCACNKSFMFPAGNGDIKKEIDFLSDTAHKNGNPLLMYSLTEKNKDLLEETYPGRFQFEEDRDSEDYLYTSESLRTLKGRKLSSKRNHINRFVENHPEWTYEKINDKNIEEAVRMHERWCKLTDCGKNQSLHQESCAVKRALKYFDELELSGGMIRIDNGICAFSIGDRLDDKTFLIHIEKAFADIRGAYAMINREFAIHNCDSYEFIDREEDTGDEGLRKAKLSYRPWEIRRQYTALEKV